MMMMMMMSKDFWTSGVPFVEAQYEATSKLTLKIELCCHGANVSCTKHIKRSFSCSYGSELD